MSTMHINLIFSLRFLTPQNLFLTFFEWHSQIISKLDQPNTDLYTRYKSTSPCDIIPWTHECDNSCTATPINKKRKLFDRPRMSSCENIWSPFLIVFYAWNIIEIPSLSVCHVSRCWSRSRRAQHNRQWLRPPWRGYYLWQPPPTSRRTSQSIWQNWCKFNRHIRID